MANTTSNPNVIKRTVYLKFLTAEGKIYTISLKHASARLAGAGGAALVKRVMEKILEINPFKVRLVKVIGAELAERSVILSTDDAADGEEAAPQRVAARPNGVTGDNPSGIKEPAGAISAYARPPAGNRVRAAYGRGVPIQAEAPP